MMNDKASMWSQNLSFIWYNDAEIFRYSDEDFDNLAKSYHDSGITIVITFSCTHFRWSFFEYWDIILDCLRRLCGACHKYGIKVVEHASSELTYNPANDDELKYIEAALNTRKSSISSWKGFIEFSESDPLIDGAPISSFRQIDGRTGKWTRSNYQGFCMCYNNPDYRKSYFKYLERVYKTGIDGIMVDDVQFFAQGNSCACEHCREQFKKETGYDLPYPENWGSFYNNYQNPAFVAWKQFKLQSTYRFHKDVNEHYTSLGYKFLRPYYVSSCLTSNWSSYCFEMGKYLWDYVFQENCFSTIIKQGFYSYAMEAVQRYAMTQRNEAPSLSLFYPDRKDTMYFAWALSRTWGQLLLATAEGTHGANLEKPYRTFEKLHSELYRNPKKLSDLTFYHSTATRDLTASGGFMANFLNTLQGAYTSGFSVDMLFEDDTLETFMRQKRIVCTYVDMMSDEELCRFAQYVRQGGKLIIIGSFATHRSDGSERPFSEILDIFGASFKSVDYIPDFYHTEVCYGASINRFSSPHGTVKMKSNIIGYQRKTTGALFNNLVRDKCVYTSSTSAELLLGAFKTENGYTVNITNVTNALAENGADVSHDDLIEPFCDNAARLTAFNLHVVKVTEKVLSCTAYSPEFDSGIDLKFSQDDKGVLNIQVPDGLFAGYCVISVKV